MATAQAIHEYVDKLPKLYKEILTAFPRIEPNRRKGYGLAFQSMMSHFQDRQLGFSLGEIILACEELEKHGLVEIKHRVFVHPTHRGEEFISAATGHDAPALQVAPLPPPPA